MRLDGRKNMKDRIHSTDVTLLVLCLGLSPYTRGLFSAGSNTGGLGVKQDG